MLFFHLPLIIIFVSLMLLVIIWFNLMVHLGSAMLVWWLVRLTLSTPVMKGQQIAKHVNVIALLAGLVFVAILSKPKR